MNTGKSKYNRLLNRFSGVCCGLLVALLLLTTGAHAAPPPAGAKPGQMVTLDFNQVDLPTFIKFVSELTQQNFAIDDRVKGKVTIYAPKRIPVERVYGVFEQVLALKGFGLVPSDDVIQVLPLTDMTPVRNINVYYLQNAKADEISKVLTGIVSRSSQAQARRAPRRGAGGGTGGQEFEGAVQVLADGPTNSLIITASPKDYKMIRKVLDKLDVRRRQVYVEAVIMEVSIRANRQFGVDLFGFEAPDPGKFTTFAGSTTSGGTGLVDNSGLTSLTRSLSGFGAGVIKQVSFNGQTVFSVGGLIQALASDADINVLSMPQILTTDNKKAEIVVGQNIPILTSRGETTGGNFNNSIERKDIGITLRFTPQILESDLVQLDLFQEISNIQSDAADTFTQEQGVITSKKSTTTTVIVEDGQTVVIGGLIEDRVDENIQKVPILGDIPLLGWLFKTVKKEHSKSNVMIFLTPHVIRDPAELFALQQRKSLEMLGYIEEQDVSRKATRIQFLEQAINHPQ